MEDQQTKQQLMRMMKYTEMALQDNIMGRRDCNEELKDFFDKNMRDMYSQECHYFVEMIII